MVPTDSCGVTNFQIRQRNIIQISLCHRIILDGIYCRLQTLLSEEFSVLSSSDLISVPSCSLFTSEDSAFSRGARHWNMFKHTHESALLISICPPPPALMWMKRSSPSSNMPAQHFQPRSYGRWASFHLTADWTSRLQKSPECSNTMLHSSQPHHPPTVCKNAIRRNQLGIRKTFF